MNLQQMQQQQQQEQVRKMNEYVQAALAGTAEVPDPYSAEVLEQLKQADQEATQVRNRIEALSTELEQLKTRRSALGGVIQQLAGTLARWKFTPPQAKDKGNGEDKDPKLVKSLEDKRKQKE